jgi:hypothetical protein
MPPPQTGGEGFGCRALRWGMVILTALATIALYISLCVPGAGSGFLWLAGGLIAGAVLLGILWSIFCPKPCGWEYLLAWQVSLSAGIAALYFAPCCPFLWWVGGALIAAALVALAAWVRACDIGWCRFIAELAVVLAGVVVPALGWIAGIPVRVAVGMFADSIIDL